MKFLILFALVAFAAARPDEGVYDEKYDNFDVDEVTGNTRLLTSYAHCFDGSGKCTPDGTNFKKWIPDAVETDCSKCTDKQKVLIAKVIKALQEKLPEEWEKLNKIYDAENKRTEQLKAFLAAHAP